MTAPEHRAERMMLSEIERLNALIHELELVIISVNDDKVKALIRVQELERERDTAQDEAQANWQSVKQWQAKAEERDPARVYTEYVEILRQLQAPQKVIDLAEQAAKKARDGRRR